MKKITLGILLLLAVSSCQKIEETVNTTVETAKQKAQQKATEAVQETVNEQLNKIVNAENIAFDSIFPQQNAALVENETGKKVAFPNGRPFYVFKYKTTDKDALLKTLVEQNTTDEAKSSKEFQKMDGASIIEKITFFEKFLPANTIDFSFLNEIKNDRSIEYYRVKRFPNFSTIIYNPKSQTVYQFVEVKK
ncbi:membrane lipoprotein lipid attachment site-containing protein [Chryseobacterium taklimakanense]|uniref:Type IV secretion system putative lipoprotein virB7 n=1 Tax=Chryseobacterium taklimakanense TaxID=536441 RepID=A0A3G8WIG4_9FLAO|nr:membrane lipoprotein lipid attachment site-containing protein [Chryseobacterium taklimakanense]AZI20965.1 hypothetical protein EIH08_09870 [Chryseobacterium taklimakanense]